MTTKIKPLSPPSGWTLTKLGARALGSRQFGYRAIREGTAEAVEQWSSLIGLEGAVQAWNEFVLHINSEAANARRANIEDWLVSADIYGVGQGYSGHQIDLDELVDYIIRTSDDLKEILK